MEHSVYGPAHARMRVIFFATPVDPSAPPKNYADSESEEARWVTLNDLKKLSRSVPGLRGPELYEWGNYLERGGAIAPLHFLCREDAPTPAPTSAFITVEESRAGRPDVVALITALERGDDATVRKAVAQETELNLLINNKQWTALHLACRLDHVEAVHALLLGGADWGALTHKRRSVLHFAAQSKLGILAMLLVALETDERKPALVNQKDVDGNTPLHFAASAEHSEELVRHGADPGIANNRGHRAGDAGL